MSAVLYPVAPRCFRVVLGDLYFYATSWKLEAVRQYAEQASVSGTTYVTNTNLRAKRLVLEGKFHFQENPAEVVLQLDTAIRANERFVFSLRGMQFVASSIVEYAIQESAQDGVLPCKLVLICTNALTAETEETT